jgi:hypothetical protein
VSLLLALALVSTPAAEPQQIARDAAPSENWGLRTIISVAAGKPPSCELQWEGAMRAWSNIIRRCANTLEVTRQLTTMPGALAELVVEERFAVGEKPKVTTASKDQLLVLHAVARLDIDAAGNRSSCRVVEGIGIMPPGLPADVCTIIPKQYVPLKGPGGTSVPFTAYFDLAWYIHVNRASGSERG